MAASTRIRVGIGGWSYDPWRETFYPAEVPKKAELEYASRQVTAIEINSTFYRLQKPSVFAKWRDSTPDDFVFSLKAPRFVTQRRTLAEAGSGIERFLGSGVSELGAKLGPLLWQLAPTQAFDSQDLHAFLQLLPASVGGLQLRHVLEVRHRSFMTGEYVALARRHTIATVFTDDAAYPSFADLTGDFVYARLRNSKASEPTGYSPAALQSWADRARSWAVGNEPTDLPRIDNGKTSARTPRDVFIYFINGAKERAPAAAVECTKRLAVGG